MTIDNELIANLLKNYKKPEDLIGENGQRPDAKLNCKRRKAKCQ